MAGRLSWLALLRAAGRRLRGLPAPLAAALPPLWMGGIWLLSSRSLGSPGDRHGFLAFAGNLAHAPLFGLLALLWTALVLRGGEQGTPRLPGAKAALVLGLVAAYGLVDEWHQTYTSGRDASRSDVVTDVVAAACVLWVVGYLGRREAAEAGLRLRLVVGVLLCSLAAWGALY